MQENTTKSNAQEYTTKNYVKESTAKKHICFYFDGFMRNNFNIIFFVLKANLN